MPKGKSLDMEVLPEKYFGDRVKILITRVGSAEKLAKLSGMSARAIGQYAAGSSDPTLGKVIALAKAADVNVLWLATGEGEMRREETQPEFVREVQPGYHSPRATDPDIKEIMDILQHDLPEAKRFVLKILRGRKETKEGLEGLGMKLKEEG